MPLELGLPRTLLREQASALIVRPVKGKPVHETLETRAPTADAFTRITVDRGQRKLDTDALVGRLQQAQRRAHAVAGDESIRVVIELIRVDQRSRVEQSPPEVGSQAAGVSVHVEGVAAALESELETAVQSPLCPVQPVAVRAQVVIA